MAATRQHASPMYKGTNAERAALSFPSDQRLLFFYETDTDDLYRWNGSSWVKIENSATVGIDDSGWVDADETWTYASADDPTFTFTITGDLTSKYSAGMRIKLTQSATVQYFIVTKVAYSDPSTTVTVYGGTDYDLADAAITEPYYSVVKAPQGFPLDPSKWTEELNDTITQSQATPTQNTWYNLGTLAISLPIGCWNVNYQVAFRFRDATGTVWNCQVSLSTSNNSVSDADFTAWLYGGNLINLANTLNRQKVVTVAAKTAYYLIARTTTANLDEIYFQSADSSTIIRAVCAYL